MINSSKGGGTSNKYLAARLKRDRPDIAARIDEYPSMRAAAIAAYGAGAAVTSANSSTALAALPVIHATHPAIGTFAAE